MHRSQAALGMSLFVVTLLSAGCGPDPILDQYTGGEEQWRSETSTAGWRMHVGPTGGDANWLVSTSEGYVVFEVDFDLEWAATGASRYALDLECDSATFCPGLTRCTVDEQLSGCSALAREAGISTLDGTFECTLSLPDDLECESRDGDGSVVEFERWPPSP